MHTSTRFRSPAAPNGTTLNTLRCTNCSTLVRMNTITTADIRIRGSACVTIHFGSYVTEKLHGSTRNQTQTSDTTQVDQLETGNLAADSLSLAPTRGCNSCRQLEPALRCQQLQIEPSQRKRVVKLDQRWGPLKVEGREDGQHLKEVLTKHQTHTMTHVNMAPTVIFPDTPNTASTGRINKATPSACLDTYHTDPQHSQIQPLP